jgi:CBS domain-containing protein
MPGLPRSFRRFSSALEIGEQSRLHCDCGATRFSGLQIPAERRKGYRMAQIGIYANRNLVMTPRNSTAREIAQTMEKFNIGAVIIGDGAEVVGMVTERTICRKIVGGKRAADSPIDDLIGDAVEAMRQGGFRYLFIVEGEPPVVTGVLSMQDLIRALSALCESEAEQLRKYVTGDLQ